MDKQIRNRGFSNALRKRLLEKHPELQEKYKDEDFYLIIDTSLEVLAELLRDGYRVIFEGYFSFFTKPIQRKCSNLHTKETWMTYKRRIRIQPMKYIKSIAEVDMEKEEYEQYILNNKKKKKEKPTA